MSKNTKILTGIILILLVISSIGIFLNRDNIRRNRELNENAVFEIYEEGQLSASYTMEEIMAMGEENFNATLDTSSTDPKEFEYTGVLLREILKKADINLEEKELAAVTGADGYTVAVSMDKIMEEDNVYLSYKIQGKPLGTRDDDGSGPYQLIIRKDQFSQNWCKYAVKADIR
jgi:DMSO/TMAO reductase YedYZ molybdopterin-dependent catalytic subunit